MSDDSKEDQPKDFVELIGQNIGQLFVISMFQARATLTLANAIKEDPAVSAETKEKAEESLQIIDKIIEQMETALPNLTTPVTIRELFGRGHE
ncbi:hypothetical protein [Pseudomonas sp. F(2018)]|uniref:hypothetical protein n=1 Tax=Pseudomonas sp. F(2018) TaxID=2502240 RepID=UPI0010F4F081|nr:hypothetical protein [Pseudomonas sp. F(2018)]